MHLRLKAQIDVRLRRAVGGNSPPDCCICNLRIPLHTNRKVQMPQKRHLNFWSEWRDSNPRHPAPKAGALPAALHPDKCLINCKSSRKDCFVRPVCGDPIKSSGLRFPSILSTAAPKTPCCICHRQRSAFSPKAGALPAALHPETDWYYTRYKRKMQPKKCSCVKTQEHFAF